MQQFIGTKQVMLLPMSRAEYNHYRGWQLPDNENGDDEGYLVEYTDGGQPNDDRHVGYISWSPKAQAEAAYRPLTAMTFGDALILLKAGQRVARAGWNGKGMWLKLVPAELADAVAFQHEALHPLPWIGMKTADQGFVPWLASQTDMLAEDWQVVN